MCLIYYNILSIVYYNILQDTYGSLDFSERAKFVRGAFLDLGLWILGCRFRGKGCVV